MTTSISRMNEVEMRKRLDHLGFTESDAPLLESLRPWAEGAIHKFVKEFYDRQLPILISQR